MAEHFNVKGSSHAYNGIKLLILSTTTKVIKCQQRAVRSSTASGVGKVNFEVRASATALICCSGVGQSGQLPRVWEELPDSGPPPRAHGRTQGRLFTWGQSPFSFLLVKELSPRSSGQGRRSPTRGDQGGAVISCFFIDKTRGMTFPALMPQPFLPLGPSASGPLSIKNFTLPNYSLLKIKQFYYN